MPIIIALGSNLENKANNLRDAISKISDHFEIEAQSRVYESPAVDYLNQPDFFNMVIQCKTPTSLDAESVMDLLLSIEKDLGRRRDIPKGPRTIDLDLLFFDLQTNDTVKLQLPHPRLFERSFVVLPLLELPYSEVLKTKFHFPDNFDNFAQAKSSLDNI
ncbi:2-amino-4-hydroxy-6-hydroxymethyldihydropteridine diphosphokinase [Bacteriovorax sp. BSW11_IV]|uniref:2-amino-4-hydroxy-6- hydroxymethyldihydropteridine diphosphokinase n=1 Tax=Bacteriovorax sp. BSW11_IV TaxID=1353529 RepID=UPI00038A2F56|nr:2-amino-4-hydroxy-6-hydroxymethyldihydropteridine diphosphokinase [Bacteriovorax sp. BSW11_IV]EQC45123.1 2-amino-4-hydroxy-6-hydroxymethyldihydropteridine diphosphokinase [Bacteriovorax sp. BSW11_IV]